MIVKIIFWNVIGANNKEKRKIIIAFLRSQRADVVCLQETKLKKTNWEVAQSLGVGRYLGWGAVNALGASGGIVVLWGTRVLRLVVLWDILQECGGWGALVVHRGVWPLSGQFQRDIMGRIRGRKGVMGWTVVCWRGLQCLKVPA